MVSLVEGARKCCSFTPRSPSFHQFLRVEYNLPAPGVMIDELHNHTTMWYVATYHVNENTSIIQTCTNFRRTTGCNTREKLAEHCREHAPRFLYLAHKDSPQNINLPPRSPMVLVCLAQSRQRVYVRALVSFFVGVLNLYIYVYKLCASITHNKSNVVLFIKRRYYIQIS